ncbi:hypothetical protein [Nitrosomonas mobilis]|uniref:Uncharacterized protein n=1 Tax=Nitrosomonas mobilis TaxID=51642 RepID=A0A1G5SH38_9PROT|nr:hypothetical protein [Nitrosomonas mobilis]SCZ86428.1 hypothetical protein NSMM_540031 [Nitrosomonas mobilis]
MSHSVRTPATEQLQILLDQIIRHIIKVLTRHGELIEYRVTWSIRSTAWTLVQLLSLVTEEAFPIDVVAPWRDKQPLTGGLSCGAVAAHGIHRTCFQVQFEPEVLDIRLPQTAR